MVEIYKIINKVGPKYLQMFIVKDSKLGEPLVSLQLVGYPINMFTIRITITMLAIQYYLNLKPYNMVRNLLEMSLKLWNLCSK